MSTVIRVEHLSKQYRLGMIGGATLREDVSRWWALKRGKEDPLAKVGAGGQTGRIGERFWALKDLSFEVKQGEILGIIGRNGAGKSTLLKILSRITAPSEGVVKVKGRIGSLLEVGTGFHPELTGRENIYLNGAILGMSRKEVDRKLDEIIAFSEVEQFIDTPVKRYSSGMYVRLAFAVAAHLDPEILIVDEVLAVGDAAFQKKCLGKMGDVAGEGRTVLFVSHNMGAVAALCGRALVVDLGSLAGAFDSPQAAISRYLSGNLGLTSEACWRVLPEQYQGLCVRPLQLRITDANGDTASGPQPCSADLHVEISVLVEVRDPAIQVGCVVRNEIGQVVYCSYNTDTMTSDEECLPLGLNVLRGPIPPRLLNAGRYTICLGVAKNRRYWLIDPAGPAPEVTLTLEGGLSDSPYWLSPREGVVAPVIEWVSASRGVA